MKISRMLAAMVVAALLGAGPAAASVADCCPPNEPASPALAAADCCGGCPSTLIPTPEPASLSLKASRLDSSPDVAATTQELAVRPLEAFAAARSVPPRRTFPTRPSPVPLRI